MAEAAGQATDLAKKLAELSAQFAGRLDGVLAELERRLHDYACDPQPAVLRDMHASLHKLAGSGGTFGFPELSSQARALEVTVKAWLDAVGPVPAKEWDLWRSSVLALRSAVEPPTPARPSAAMPSPGGKAAEGKGPVRLQLVLADSEVAAGLQQGLEPFGYSVRTSADLAQALSEAQAALPDVLLLQIADDPGFMVQCVGASHQLAQMQGRHIPVVFLAPNASFELKLAAASAGGDLFFALPVDAPTVAAGIERLLRDARQPPFRVLIVDDDEALAEHYCLTLRAAGLLAERVSKAATVMPTLQRLRPDVLLMDLYMPECFGADLARVIRYDESWQSLPIIFVSAESDLDRQKLALGSGADDFLVKPIQDAQLVAAVRARALRARRLSELMSQDGLTGLLKHASIKDRLAQELDRASRHGKPVAAVMVDIDFFKRVNDSWGHPMGDQVIKTLGQMLRQRLRRQDSVGRYGGEEFLAVLPECSAADAGRLLDDIRERFAAVTFTSAGHPFSVTLSAGIASSEMFRTEQDILAAADAALYQAKHSGRNRVVTAAMEDSSK